jgi:hypothetical protein
MACVLAHAAALGALSVGRARSPALAANEESKAVQVRLLPAPHIATAERQRTPALSAVDRQPVSPRAPSLPGKWQLDAKQVAADASRQEEVATDAATHAAGLLAVATDSPYLPTNLLDIRPMPRSAPNEAYVESAHKSGLPIRVRLFVEEDGVISTVEVLSVAPGDEEAAAQVISMFRDTAFSPGRRGGRDVASFMDIEVILESKLPELAPLVLF